MSKSSSIHGTWDRCGICASVACTVHCMAAPLIFLFMPHVGEVWAHPASHALMAVFVLPLAFTVIFRGYRSHGRRSVLIAATLGCLFIGAGSILPYTEKEAPPREEVLDAHACSGCCPQVVESAEGEEQLVIPAASVVTTMGSLLLIGAHVGNLLARRKCCPSAGV